MAVKNTKRNTRTSRERQAPKPAKISKAMQRRNETESALRDLRPLARTINSKLRSAANFEGKVDDARLAACVALSEAYERASAGHVRFKSWCEENISALGYESLRKMRPIGDAERAEEGAGLTMLREMRERNAGANRKHRAGKGGGEGSDEGAGSQSGAGTRPTDLGAAIREIFLRLSDEAQIEFAAWVESHIGAHEADETA